FSNLFSFIQSRQRWDLADNATIRQFGFEGRVPLKTLRDASRDSEVFFCKDGADRALLEALRSQGKKVAILSQDAKRQFVEQQYLQKYCKAKVVDERINCTQIFDARELSGQETAFISAVLETL